MVNIYMYNIFSLRHCIITDFIYLLFQFLAHIFSSLWSYDITTIGSLNSLNYSFATDRFNCIACNYRWLLQFKHINSFCIIWFSYVSYVYSFIRSSTHRIVSCKKRYISILSRSIAINASIRLHGLHMMIQNTNYDTKS